MRGRGSGGAVLGQAGFCQGKHEAQEEDAFHAGKFNREGATAQRILGGAWCCVGVKISYSKCLDIARVRPKTQ